MTGDILSSFIPCLCAPKTHSEFAKTLLLRLFIALSLTDHQLDSLTALIHPRAQ